MKNIFTNLAFALIFPSALLAQSDSAVGSRYFENLQTGWRTYAETAEVPMSTNIRILEAEQKPETQLRMFNYWLDPTRIVILAQGDKIIAERNLLRQDAIVGGNSMSKSVTSLAVGLALCRGDIIDINDEAQAYAPELYGTTWGASTVRQLLMMSSGAYPTRMDLHGHPNVEMQQEMTRAIMGNDSDKLADILRRHDVGVFQSGTRFNYSNADITALGLVLKGATGQETATLFAEIWNEVGASTAGSWLLNSHGETVTYMGFAANPYDWIRLGLFVSERMKEDDCFGNYLKNATSTQIDYQEFADNRNYGYQFWTDCGIGFDAFCMVGAFGQFVLINSEQNVVLYVHSVSQRWGGVNHWGAFFFESLADL